MTLGQLLQRKKSSPRLEHAALSSLGHREQNQDYADAYADPRQGLYCYVLADGLGGHQAGRIAARTAVEFLLARLAASAEEATAAGLTEVLREANDQIKRAAASQPELEGMQTTCCLVLVQGPLAWSASVGDSRVYFFREGSILQRSRDDSVVQLLLDLGEIGADQVADHPDRNRIVKALGMEGDLRLGQEPRCLELRSGDRILLCSDGFWENFSDPELAQVFGPRTRPAAPARILQGLFALAEKRAAQQGRRLDNLSAQLIVVH